MHHASEFASARLHGVQDHTAFPPRAGSRSNRRCRATLIVALVLAAPVAAPAQESAPAGAPAPVVFHASWTQFLGWAVEGQGQDVSRLGGKLATTMVFAGEALGLWDGFTVNVSGEFGFGRNVNQSGTGVILPLNTALVFPSNGEEDWDVSVNFTQRIGASSLTFGKINMLDNVARTPLVGGGGLEGFQHVALAAPPSELSPPTIFGAIWSRPSRRASVTVGAWDVTSALNRTGLDSPFSEGVAGMVSVVVPARLAGRRGFHGVNVMGTSKRGLDLRDIGDTFLPPESEAILGRKRGGWHVKYVVQQFLHEDPADPSRGWGVFGHIGTWDANPTPMQWSLTAGVTGTVPLQARPADRFGVGYFRSSFSRTLQEGLQPILVLGDEQGVEAFYTVEIVRRLRLTATGQWVSPAIEGVSNATVLALRTRVAF